jgi:hypothetical protein
VETEVKYPREKQRSTDTATVVVTMTMTTAKMVIIHDLNESMCFKNILQ